MILVPKDCYSSQSELYSKCPSLEEILQRKRLGGTAHLDTKKEREKPFKVAN